MNFFVTGDIAAAHSGQTTKAEGKGKPEQFSKEAVESFGSALSKSLLASLLATSSPENGKVGLETSNDEEILEGLNQEMDELLSMQLSMLNEVQEMENNPSISSQTEDIPEGYYDLLEDVMDMMNVLTTLKQSTQGEGEKMIESFTRLSEKVMMFMKGYLEAKEEKAEGAPVSVKEQSNLKELMSMIETRLGKLLLPESARTQVSPLAKDAPSKHATFVPVSENVFQSGPVTMNLLQLPKQATIQWVIDTTSHEAAREQLLQKLEGILAKTQTRFVNGNQSMTIRLAPEHLGTLHIKLQETQHGLVAKLIVHSKAASSLLESGLINLKQTLAQSNVNIEKLEVIFQDQEQKFTQQHKGTGDDESHPKHSSKNETNDEDNTSSFEDVLLEELEIRKAVGDGE